jgi:hypothetical protein
MIEKLTKEQKENIIKYYDKYLEKGLSCEDLPENKQIEIIKKLYKKNNIDEPIIMFMDSPFGCIIMYNIWQNIEQNIGRNIWRNIGQNIKRNIGQNIERNIGQNIRQNIWQNIGQNIERNIKRNIEQNIWQNIWQNIEQNIWQNIERNIWQNIWQNIDQNMKIENFWHGQHNVNWMGYYSYFHDNFNFSVKDEVYYNILIELCDLHWFLPFEKLCIISKKCKKINLNTNNLLHCTDGMALYYGDGYGLYMLNGVNVGEKIVMTPADQLDCNLVLTEKNAQIRCEIVKKIGMKRILKELKSECIDSKEIIINKKNGYITTFDILNKMIKYELLLLNIGDNRERPYLKMLNPSTGEIHIEGVPPEINTIEKALNWRTYGNDFPIALT